MPAVVVGISCTLHVLGLETFCMHCFARHVCIIIIVSFSSLLKVRSIVWSAHCYIPNQLLWLLFFVA